jgi:hypothetical protein
MHSNISLVCYIPLYTVVTVKYNIIYFSSGLFTDTVSSSDYTKSIQYVVRYVIISIYKGMSQCMTLIALKITGTTLTVVLDGVYVYAIALLSNFCTSGLPITFHIMFF